MSFTPKGYHDHLEHYFSRAGHLSCFVSFNRWSNIMTFFGILGKKSDPCANTAIAPKMTLTSFCNFCIFRYAKTWADAFEKIPNLYAARPPLDDFFAWRDLRVMDEVRWYGWFIDYWMEVSN